MTHSLVLPRISGQTAARLNTFYAGGQTFSFALGGTDWRFAPYSGTFEGNWAARIYSSISGQQLMLFLNNTLPASWEGGPYDLPTLLSLPPNLAGAALEISCRELLQQFSVSTSYDIVFTGLNLEEEPVWLPDEALCFCLTRADGATTLGAVVAPTELLDDLSQLFCAQSQLAVLSPHAPTPGQPISSGLECTPLVGFSDPATLVPFQQAYSVLPCPCIIFLCGPELTYEELRGLEPGDILLTTHPVPGDVGLFAVLYSATLPRARVRVQDTLIYVENLMTENTEAVTAAVDDAAPAQEEALPKEAQVPDFGSLPVQIGFDLGGLTLSFADLAALAPGQVLTTGRGLSAPVHITAAGKRIGTGSLLDVDGRVGVRIETIIK